MYILYNNVKYPCKCRPASTMVYSGLPEDFPAPVTGEIVLCADDDFVMRTDKVEDYLRQTFDIITTETEGEDGEIITEFVEAVLTLTNTPEPEPEPDPEPGEPEPTIEERMTALENAIAEGVTLYEEDING